MTVADPHFDLRPARAYGGFGRAPGRSARSGGAASSAFGIGATWPVVGIIVLMVAESVVSSFSYPYFSLILEKQGLQSWVIGLNASVAGLGILVVGPFLPRAIARFGLRRMSSGMFVAALVCFVAVFVIDSVAVWFVSRFVMGACFAALWATTEIWLNGVVDEERRGRTMAAAMIAYTAAQFAGPLSLSLTGTTGRAVAISVFLPLVVGAVVALSIRGRPGSATGASGQTEPVAFARAFSLAGPLIAAGFVCGLAATAIQSLMPIFGLAHGLSDEGATRLVVVFSLGEALMVGAFGLAADRFNRWRLLRMSAIPSVLVAVAMPFTVSGIGILDPTLFLAGGTLAGIHTLGIILIGQEFRGQRLAVVSTAFAMAYSAGAVVGATPIGFLIDIFGANALLTALVASFLALAACVSRRWSIEPEIAEYHVSLRPAALAPFVRPGRDERQRGHVENTPVSELQMRNDRQRKESNLEEWFRQRAADIERRAAERHKSRSEGHGHSEAHQAG